MMIMSRAKYHCIALAANTIILLRIYNGGEDVTKDGHEEGVYQVVAETDTCFHTMGDFTTWEDAHEYYHTIIRQMNKE